MQLGMAFNKLIHWESDLETKQTWETIEYDLRDNAILVQEQAELNLDSTDGLPGVVQAKTYNW